jgi:hypothetical protein
MLPWMPNCTPPFQHTACTSATSSARSNRPHMPNTFRPDSLYPSALTPFKLHPNTKRPTHLATGDTSGTSGARRAASSAALNPSSRASRARRPAASSRT